MSLPILSPIEASTVQILRGNEEHLWGVTIHLKVQVIVTPTIRNPPLGETKEHLKAKKLLTESNQKLTKFTCYYGKLMLKIWPKYL